MPLESANTLFLIDSSIYVFRAWFTLPDSIQTPDGQPVNALYGFTDFLAQIQEQVEPEYMVCAFDKSLGTSERNRIYPEYKANRDPAPENLKRQFSLCQQVAELCGYAQFARPRYEADDIIGTLAATAAAQGFNCCIVSADKDLTQFIGEQDTYWNFARKERLSYGAVRKRFGIKPGQMADMLAICGDKVDNIPGIPGVGAATAAKLLVKWQDLDGVFANVSKVAEMKFRGAKRVSELLTEHESTVRLARKLTGLLPVSDLPSSVKALKRQGADLAGLEQFMTAQGFSDRRQQRLLDVFDNTGQPAGL